MCQMRWAVLLWLHAFFLWIAFGEESIEVTADGSEIEVEADHGRGYAQTCYEWTGSACSWEPNLHRMEFEFAGQPAETFYAYKTPDVSTFYNKTEGTMAPAKLAFYGMFSKFINLSPDPIKVYWTSTNRKEPLYISDIEPFGAAGTASYVGHTFIATPASNPKKTLVEWNVVADNCLYYYDPLDSNLFKAHKLWTEAQYTLYYLQVRNKEFAKKYKEFTNGTDWLGLYGQKMPPRYHMWRADYIGQVYEVETKELHFVEFPTPGELARGASAYGPRQDERLRVRPHRDVGPTMTMTMTVLSCAPRVFEIKNFLSEIEVQHILNIAAQKEMIPSTTKASEGSETTKNSSTRTSTQNWIARNTDIVIDAIYRRAADLLSIDEALLRWRHKNEIPEFHESKMSIAERLQLVHYSVGQQYTPHHDFTIPNMVHLQPSRFATVLFYLNDDMEGGQTSFPRWLNAETSQSLKVKPERGKAVLFYSVLPDGNFDERSMHAAMPVQKGEKFLTNLWVWDPVLDHTKTVHL